MRVRVQRRAENSRIWGLEAIETGYERSRK